ncbi:MAG: ABC transporter ATP-binding protein [Ignavibacteriales bacterium]|nr:ABC transporter ATP-binding protein [Ignavibacteriales bacterium]
MVKGTAGDIVLRISGLVKRYKELTAVDNLSLEIYRGEVFGFLGPNGAGKTTAIQMMTGILKPDAGEIFIQGEKLTDHGKAKSKVGVCPQSIVIWNKMTCIEQLEFVGTMYDIPAKIAHERGIQLLADMGLLEKQNKLAGTLSGGMQRRLNLIIGLIHDPDIIVLDEPEAGLDPQSRVLVRDYIKTLAGKKTVILTTHNMDEADRVCNRIAIIDHGKLLLVDTPENLKKGTGEGDIFEISMNNFSGSQSASIISSFKTLAEFVSISNNTLLLRTTNILEKLPAILDLLKQQSISTGEIRFRENTLEDVFINLTGRSLRE